MIGSSTSQRTADPTDVLNAVCREGWELVNGSFVFVEQGQQSRDKFMSPGPERRDQGHDGWLLPLQALRGEPADGRRLSELPIAGRSAWPRSPALWSRRARTSSRCFTRRPAPCCPLRCPLEYVAR